MVRENAAKETLHCAWGEMFQTQPIEMGVGNAKACLHTLKGLRSGEFALVQVLGPSPPLTRSITDRHTQMKMESGNGNFQGSKCDH